MKDPQKLMLYLSEWVHSAYKRPSFHTIENANKWIHGVVGSRWFGKYWPHMAHSRILLSRWNEDHCTAVAINNTIHLASWGLKKLILCHELAHLCNVDSEVFQQLREYKGLGRRKKQGLASHGKRFCGTYLKIVEKAISKESAKELRNNFNRFGVRYE